VWLVVVLSGVEAAVLVFVLASVLGWSLRRPVGLRPGLRVAGAVGAFYGVYVGLVVATPPGARSVALRHGRLFARLEFGAPVERASVWLLAHSGPLASVAEFWYLWAHLVGTFLALALLVVFGGPSGIRRFGSGLLVLSVVALAVFAVFPVAPPALTLGRGVWLSRLAASGELPWSAFPSLHVAWADWSGITVSSLLPASRWRSLVRYGYPAVTTCVVLATGNHWVLDCLGGTVLCLLSLALTGWAGRCRPLRSCSPPLFSSASRCRLP
jgi:diacylglycerol O-acyltransferase